MVISDKHKIFLFSKYISIIQIFQNLIFFQICFLVCPNQNILVFDSTHYRAGHSAFTSNGDMIIEFSYQNQRLYYGLKKNGKHYFKENDIYVPTKNFNHKW